MNSAPVQPSLLLKNPAGWIASGFGAGFSPVIPGTIGSLAALLPYLLLRELPLPLYLGVVTIAFLLGIWASGIVVRTLNISDPQVIVWDEFVGQWLTLTFAAHRWDYILSGFILFRVFDIWKPWPIGWVDRTVKGGLGVMLDDLLAGVYAGAALMLINKFL